jgi:hypothetical protein
MNNEQMIRDFDLAAQEVARHMIFRGAQENPNCYEYNKQYASLLAKLNRCDELQAIVDRLPKTADNFPAYRGLRLWEPLVDIDQGGNKFIYDYGDMTVNYLESEKYIAGCYRHHPTTGKTVEESES